MKTQILIATVLGTSLATLGQATAGEKELTRSQVPNAVLGAFEKAHPNVQSVEFEEGSFEGKTAYEVEYKENGREYELLYSADGSLVQKEEEIDIKALPESIVQSINRAYPKATIKEAEKVMKPDGEVIAYEVEIKEGGKEFEIELDAGGKILKSEQD